MIATGTSYTGSGPYGGTSYSNDVTSHNYSGSYTVTYTDQGDKRDRYWAFRTIQEVNRRLAHLAYSLSSEFIRKILRATGEELRVLLSDIRALLGSHIPVPLRAMCTIPLYGQFIPNGWDPAMDHPARSPPLYRTY